jgi:hypothetical protein
MAEGATELNNSIIIINVIIIQVSYLRASQQEVAYKRRAIEILVFSQHNDNKAAYSLT